MSIGEMLSCCANKIYALYKPIMYCFYGSNLASEPEREHGDLNKVHVNHPSISKTNGICHLKWAKESKYGCMIMNAALSRSQFCFDFLQNYGQGSLVSSNVCYWKSAKSVNNFRSKKRTAFTKNRFLVFKPVSEVRGSIPGGDKSFATWFLLLLR